MLSRSVKQALLDSRWGPPPAFLLPWAATLTTVAHTSAVDAPPPMPSLPNQPSDKPRKPSSARRASPTTPIRRPQLPTPSQSTTPAISPSVRELLPLLKSQPPHYITLHIHGKPYLLTQGDTIRLPFLMHGVEPGDVLRMNRAITIGSRDYTLKAAAPGPKMRSPTTDTRNVLDPTTGKWASQTQTMPQLALASGPTPMTGGVVNPPHFIPHIAKGKHAYLDERLFVCRAVVMGVESEPLRIKEKTKRRQRKVKKVKSKHRFTVLKVKELRVKDLEEVGSE